MGGVAGQRENRSLDVGHECRVECASGRESRDAGVGCAVDLEEVADHHGAARDRLDAGDRARQFGIARGCRRAGCIQARQAHAQCGADVQEFPAQPDLARGREADVSDRSIDAGGPGGIEGAAAERIESGQVGAHTAGDFFESAADVEAVAIDLERRGAAIRALGMPVGVGLTIGVELGQPAAGGTADLAEESGDVERVAATDRHGAHRTVGGRVPIRARQTVQIESCHAATGHTRDLGEAPCDQKVAVGGERDLLDVESGSPTKPGSTVPVLGDRRFR